VSDEGENRVQSEQLLQLVRDCENHLCVVVDALPDRRASFASWCRSLVELDAEVLGALGLPTSPEERRALAIGVDSDAPAFVSLRRTLRERFGVYLGGLVSIFSNYDIAALRSREAKIVDLASMVAAADGAKRTTMRRTPEAVARAVRDGDLAMYRTSEVDSDLWVVLKTLQEWRSLWRTRDCMILIERLVEISQQEVTNPQSRIADRRHAWWAARTLVEVSADAALGVSAHQAADLIWSLLSRPVYVPALHVAERTFVPEAEGDATTLWELVNVAEAIRCSAGVLPEHSLTALCARRDTLVTEVLHDRPIRGVRQATVAVRAALEAIDSMSPSGVRR